MDKRFKGTRIFLIIYGAAIAFFSIYSLLLLLIMRTSPSHMPVGKVWLVFMPLLAIIGLAFLFFGVLIEKNKSKRMLIFLLISLSSIIWYILYAFFAGAVYNFPFMGNTDVISTILKVLFYIMMVACSAVFIVPELIIWRNLKRIEGQNKTE